MTPTSARKLCPVILIRRRRRRTKRMPFVHRANARSFLRKFASASANSISFRIPRPSPARQPTNKPNNKRRQLTSDADSDSGAADLWPPLPGGHTHFDSLTCDSVGRSFVDVLHPVAKIADEELTSSLVVGSFARSLAREQARVEKANKLAR